MRRFAIIGDSTCDLNKELRTEYEIDYVPMNFVLNGNEYEALLDWENISAKEFYDEMRAGKDVKTTQVPGHVYEKKFRQYLDMDMDVLYISCSSALSGSVNTARVVAKELDKEYKRAGVICIDSLNSSFGQGIQLMRASRMRAEGKGIDEAAGYIEKNRNRVNQCGTVGKLDYLRRAGRVTASSAFFGNLIGIKPIIISDARGQNFAVKKTKGMANAINGIAEHINSVIEDAKDQTVYISHADADADVEKLSAAIKEKTGCRDIYTDHIRPIVGASVGPGTVIAFCVGKEETTIGEA